MRTAPAVLLPALVAVAIALWLGARGASARPAAPDSGDPGAEAPGEPAAATGPAGVAPASAAPPRTARPPADAAIGRTPVEAQRPGVFGVVVDDLGDALPGLLVRMLAVDAHPREAQLTTSDDEGRFAFPGASGHLDVEIHDHVRAAARVELAPGERRDVTLQVDGPCVLVVGTLHAGSRPVHDRTVGAHGRDRDGAEVHHDAHSGHDGSFVHLLRPGDYELTVAGPPTSIAWSLKGTTVWAEVATEAAVHARVSLTPAQRRHRVALTLPGARVRAAVRTHDGAPVSEATVTIRPAAGGGPTWSRRTDDDGTILFAELPPGEWEVRAQHDLHRATDAASVVTTARDDLIDVTLTMAAGGALRVRLLRDGELFEPLDAGALELHVAGDDPREGRRAEGRMWLYEGIDFEAVPVGAHELRCEDRATADGRIRFAPIEPFAPRSVAIRAGERTQLDLAVRPRPRLLLDVRGGPEQDTVITVTCPRGRVTPSRLGHDHWQAAVPPGDYTVHVRRGDLERTEHVAVFGEEVTRTIRMTP